MERRVSSPDLPGAASGHSLATHPSLRAVRAEKGDTRRTPVVEMELGILITEMVDVEVASVSFFEIFNSSNRREEKILI